MRVADDVRNGIFPVLRVKQRSREACSERDTCVLRKATSTTESCRQTDRDNITAEKAECLRAEEAETEDVGLSDKPSYWGTMSKQQRRNWHMARKRLQQRSEKK